MNEDVACEDFFLESILIEKTGEIDALADPEIGGLRAEGIEKGAISGDDETGGWSLFLNLGERLERSGEAFFFDEPAGLEKPPFAVGGGRPTFGERPRIEGDAGAVKTEFARRAAKRGKVFEQSFGTGKDERGTLKHFLERRTVGRLSRIDARISPVKRDDHRARAGTDEREELDGDMPEVDVHDAGVEMQGAVDEVLHFTSADLNRRIFYRFAPKAAHLTHDRIRARQWPDAFFREGEALGVFALSREDTRPVAGEPIDLAVDVEHIPLEKIQTDASDCWWLIPRPGLRGRERGAS